MTAATGTEWLTSREVAHLLRVHEATLAAWRMQGRGPAFTKLARSAVRYRSSDIDAWMSERQVPMNGL